MHWAHCTSTIASVRSSVRCSANGAGVVASEGELPAKFNWLMAVHGMTASPSS